MGLTVWVVKGPGNGWRGESSRFIDRTPSQTPPQHRSVALRASDAKPRQNVAAQVLWGWGYYEGRRQHVSWSFEDRLVSVFPSDSDGGEHIVGAPLDALIVQEQ